MGWIYSLTIPWWPAMVVARVGGSVWLPGMLLYQWQSYWLIGSDQPATRLYEGGDECRTHGVHDTSEILGLVEMRLQQIQGL